MNRRTNQVHGEKVKWNLIQRISWSYARILTSTLLQIHLILYWDYTHDAWPLCKIMERISTTFWPIELRTDKEHAHCAQIVIMICAVTIFINHIHVLDIIHCRKPSIFIFNSDVIQYINPLRAVHWLVYRLSNTFIWPINS